MLRKVYPSVTNNIFRLPSIYLKQVESAGSGFNVGQEVTVIILDQAEFLGRMLKIS